MVIRDPFKGCWWPPNTGWKGHELNHLVHVTGTWTSTTWTYFQVDLCLAMLNLGDALVTLAAFFVVVVVVLATRKQQLWQRKWWNDKLVDTISDAQNFDSWKTEVADSSGFYTLKQCARSGFWARSEHDSASCACSRKLKIHTPPPMHHKHWLLVIMHMNSLFHFISNFRLGRFWVLIQESDACGVLPISHLCSSWRGRRQQGVFSRDPLGGSFGLLRVGAFFFSGKNAGGDGSFSGKLEKNIISKKRGQPFPQCFFVVFRSWSWLKKAFKLDLLHFYFWPKILELGREAISSSPNKTCVCVWDFLGFFKCPHRRSWWQSFQVWKRCNGLLKWSMKTSQADRETFQETVGWIGV